LLGFLTVSWVKLQKELNIKNGVFKHQTVTTFSSGQLLSFVEKKNEIFCRTKSSLFCKRRKFTKKCFFVVAKVAMLSPNGPLKVAEELVFCTVGF
jgi:hypothetical protein